MSKPTKLAQSLQLSDLKTYEAIWNLRDREKPYDWEQVREHFNLDIKSGSLQKSFKRLAELLKKPYAHRGKKTIEKLSLMNKKKE